MKPYKCSYLCEYVDVTYSHCVEQTFVRSICKRTVVHQYESADDF